MSLFKRGGILSVILGIAFLFALLALGITQETPIGSVSGTVTMSENGQPLPNTAVTLTPVGADEDGPSPRLVFTDKRGEFQIAALPAGAYKIEASARAHELESSNIEVREGSVTPLSLELKPMNPELRLYSSQRVFMPDEVPQVEAHGFGNGNQLSIGVYRIELSKFLKAGSFYGVLYSLTDNYYNNGKRLDPSQVGTLVSSTTHTVQNMDAEGVFTDVINLDKLKEGFYWVSCDMGGLRRGAFISISRIALVTKSSPGRSLCFVTDLKTGKALPGVPISMNQGDKWVSAGTTDRSGLANLNYGGKNRKVLVLATQGDSQAVSGFANYGSEYYGEGEDEKHDENTTIFAYTDRPIYRPGDDVQFKGFARKRVGSDYTLPGKGTVECEVEDESGTLVKQFKLELQANGSFAGHFQSSEESTPGQYTVSFKTLGNQENMSFTLAAYRKPEFTVKVLWSKKRYASGESMQATVKCEYYFGGPVAGAKVNATLYKNQIWWEGEEDSEDYDAPNESDSEPTGDYVESQEGTTDANGEAVFNFQPKKPEKDEKEDSDYPTDYQYTLSAEVAEAGDKYFDGSGSTRVSQGEFQMEVDTDKYIVAPGQRFEATVTARDYESQKPIANQPVTLVYGYETWAQDREVYADMGHVDART